MSGTIETTNVSNAERDLGDEQTQDESLATKRFLFFNLVPSWSISFVVHVVLIVGLAVWFLQSQEEPPVSFEVGTSTNTAIDDVKVDLSAMDMEEMTLEVPDAPALDDAPKLDELTPTQLEVPETSTNLSEMFSESAVGSLADAGAVSGMGETSGRTGEAKRKLLKEAGGTEQSEECVELALEWLAAHQLKDGSWNFDHTGGGGKRSQKNPGNHTQHINAATALALLPFLGSGYTHKDGKYQDVVRRGLRFLIETRGVNSGNGFSFYRANNLDDMYSHGLVSIVLCEAYGMTEDSWLQSPAQGSLNFIEFAQHSEGGWRYDPKMRGDTSVVGWQVMALKSGKMAGLKVSDTVITKTSAFLDRVSIDTGAHYGYMDKPSEIHGGHKTCTAIGLLCRMYLGWDRERPGIVNGVDFLMKQGPYLGSKENPLGANMYYNYYATQVVKQFGGPKWTKWNEEMRDYLVKTMDRDGAERGSWFFPGGDLGSSDGHPGGGGAGGRLYCTAMAAMTLEVYYRYMPLYKDKAVEDDFKLK
ncbi:MAG: prenyltransferase/squalene oxidase repeat-containing protein [Pirellulaceae bacterium]